MMMTPSVRRLALTIHLALSLGWIGAVVSYLVLGLSAVRSKDAETVRAAWIAMELTGWWAIVPLAIGSLLTGLIMSLGTSWGLFRHYWVLITLALTIFCVAILLLHMPTVSAMTQMARAGTAVRDGYGGDLLHPSLGLLVLLVITVLNVYKAPGRDDVWLAQAAGASHGEALAPAHSPRSGSGRWLLQLGSGRATGNQCESLRCLPRPN